jgi:uncharacterized membrane protein YqaE (UPF0057 family)
MSNNLDLFVAILLAFIFPPLGVAMERGYGADFCINLFLTLLFYFPGIIDAIYLILHNLEDRRVLQDLRNARRAAEKRTIPNSGNSGHSLTIPVGCGCADTVWRGSAVVGACGGVAYLAEYVKEE